MWLFSVIYLLRKLMRLKITLWLRSSRYTKRTFKPNTTKLLNASSGTQRYSSPSLSKGWTLCQSMRKCALDALGGIYHTRPWSQWPTTLTITMLTWPSSSSRSRFTWRQTKSLLISRELSLWTITAEHSPKRTWNQTRTASAFSVASANHNLSSTWSLSAMTRFKSKWIKNKSGRLIV